MALNFNPEIYRQEDTEAQDRDFMLRALQSLGTGIGGYQQNRRANESADLQRRVTEAGITDQYGTMGARRILKPTPPPRRLFGRQAPQVQPLPDPGLESFDMSDPQQMMQARQMYGSSGVQPYLDARKYGNEAEDRDLSRRNIESEIMARNTKARALSQNGGKPPAGYRWNEAGDLEAIPGGPAYMKAGEKSGDMNAAFNLYNEARRGLLEGLRGTNTGPIAGRIPAVTSAQQVAQGGVAAMAPVLKQLFRVSGEGVFTDRDQQLLLDMIPTRVTNPEAITTQMENIDNIVRAKLRMPRQGGGQRMEKQQRNKTTGETRTVYSDDGGQTWHP